VLDPWRDENYPARWLSAYWVENDSKVNHQVREVRAMNSDVLSAAHKSSLTASEQSEH